MCEVPTEDLDTFMKIGNNMKVDGLKDSDLNEPESNLSEFESTKEISNDKSLISITETHNKVNEKLKCNTIENKTMYDASKNIDNLVEVNICIEGNESPFADIL